MSGCTTKSRRLSRTIVCASVGRCGWCNVWTEGKDMKYRQSPSNTWWSSCWSPCIVKKQVSPTLKQYHDTHGYFAEAIALDRLIGNVYWPTLVGQECPRYGTQHIKKVCPRPSGYPRRYCAHKLRGLGLPSFEKAKFIQSSYFAYSILALYAGSRSREARVPYRVYTGWITYGYAIISIWLSGHYFNPQRSKDTAFTSTAEKKSQFWACPSKYFQSIDPYDYGQKQPPVMRMQEGLPDSQTYVCSHRIS